MLRRLAAIAAPLLVLTVALTGLPSQAAPVDDPGQAAQPSGRTLTVSWPLENRPTQLAPGLDATSTLWVTNTGTEPRQVAVEPAIGVPGDNGSLTVASGTDPRFRFIQYQPDHFALAAGKTQEVRVTVRVPDDVKPGVYLLPAVVRPIEAPQAGNIKIEYAVVALNTFQVPGPVDARFTAALEPTGLVRYWSFLPAVAFGKESAATLTIRSESSAGMLAHYEVSGERRGIGSIEFEGHVEGASDFLIGEPAIYYPNTQREFPISWQNSPLSAGIDVITAQVSFNPDPQTLATVSAETTIITVSTWWIAVLALAVLALLLLIFFRGRGTSRPIVTTVLLGLLAIVLALYADPLALVVLAALAVVLSVLAFVLRPARRWLVVAVTIGAGVTLAGATVLVGLAELAGWSPGYAVAAAAIGIAWTVVAAWLHRRLRIERADQALDDRPSGHASEV